MLTTFLDNKEVKSKFSETFKLPKLTYSKEIKIEPATKNYTAVGIAFDYLLRFYITRLNKTLANDFTLIAEKAILFLKGKQADECKALVKITKKAIEKYLKSKGLDEELLILLLQISNYDIVFRTGRIDLLPEDIGKVSSWDVIDLKKLYSLLQDDMWKCKKTCLLNPSFGNASLLVGGADADLILDDMLIDIKVTKKEGMKRDFFNQLMGYYILHRIAIPDKKLSKEISKLGIYSARFGELISFNVDDVIDENSFDDFCKWLINKAGELYHHSSDFMKTFSR